MKKLHLICNAHLDPVWLWEWEEGAAEALSTFRIAADFCEEYHGFVFNHNEAILYQWIEEYDPSLFKRIQELVKEGKWHIMGGWFLQPDCNMPSGESFVRQALKGRNYFKEKFNVTPTTAINFDSFGHTRGLVQILNKAGYDSYIVCRPSKHSMSEKAKDFIWVGYDGSEIIVHRSDENYNSIRGKAANEIEEWVKENNNDELGLFLWGIGNHGGGPSRIDLNNIAALKERMKDEIEILDSCPEEYFNVIKKQYFTLPKFSKGLNPVAQGCYTSQIRIKQLHRQLENDIYMVEKMASSASLQGGLKYPKEEIDAAIYDLMTAEFHDALPGSAIQPVENATLRILNHGLEITSRLKTRAFFALSKGQDKVKNGETPILIYNPHPYSIKGIFECEFVLPSQNWEDNFYNPVIYQGETRIPSQAEQEYSNFRIDWRKHASFEAELLPGQMNRYDCRFEILPKRPEPSLKAENGKTIFKTDTIFVEINCETGLIDKYIVDGVNYISGKAFLPIVVNDSYNSWGGFSSYRNIQGEFKLMSKEEGSKFSALPNKNLDSVRVIEDGDVRTVVEAVFSYGSSFICQQYKLPKCGSEIQVDVRVFWNEKDKMLKLSVPTSLQASKYIGQTAYGFEELDSNGEEVVSQKWCAAVSEENSSALTCINDCIYGSDFKDGEIRLTLLRSASYATADFLGRPAMPQDRYTERMDQGERVYSFWINAGELKNRLDNIEREALVHNEKPFALSYCPSGEGKKINELITLSNRSVQLSTFKKAEKSEDYIIRLFESKGHECDTWVTIPALNINRNISLKAFEIKTLRLKVESQILMEANLMED